MSGSFSNRISTVFVIFLLCNGFIGCLEDEQRQDDESPNTWDDGDEFEMVEEKYNCHEDKPIFEDVRNQTVADYIYNFLPSSNSGYDGNSRNAFYLHMNQNGSWKEMPNELQHLKPESKRVQIAEQNDYLYRVTADGYWAESICDFEIVEVVDTGRCVLHAEMITIIQARYTLNYFDKSTAWSYSEPLEIKKNNQYYVIAKSKLYHEFYQENGLWGIMPEGDFTTTFDCNADIKPNFDKDNDSDGDGISDIYETNIYKTSVNNSDTDGDGLSDYDELFIYSTNPKDNDTDNDGVTDYFEIERPDLYKNESLPLFFDEGLVGYWPFKENEGNIISDLGVYKNNASFKGGFSPPQWTKGKENNALGFDGLDDYVVLESSESMNSTGNKSTILMWTSFDFNASSSQEILLEKHDGTNGFILTSEIDKQNRIERHEDNEGNIVEVGTPGWKTHATFKLYSYLDKERSDSYRVCSIDEFHEFGEVDEFENRWHHIAVTLERGGQANLYRPNIFVNGQLCGEEGSSHGGGYLLNSDKPIESSTIIIGNVRNANLDADFLLCPIWDTCTNATDIKAFSGRVDEIAIWNKILTYDEIKEIAGASPKEMGFSSNPILKDTDGDGLSDYEEINILGSNPLDYAGDLDNDGLADNIEFFMYNTDPDNNDTDGDGINDFDDYECFSCNHLGNDEDNDGDGLKDSFEIDGDDEEGWEINALNYEDIASYWTFNEGMGQSISGKGYNKKYVNLEQNGPSWADGLHPVYGNALEFDGVDDKIIIPISYEWWSSGTISLWMKPNSLAPNDGFAQVITGGFYGEDVRVPTIAINENGKIMWEIGDNTNNIIDVDIEDDTWHQLVFTWKPIDYNTNITTDEIYVYINGAMVDHIYQTSNWKQDHYFQLGAYHYLGESRSFFNGTIDDVALWEKALNQSEVADLYNDYNFFLDQRLNPNDADTDGDGLDDKLEIFLLGSDPFNKFGDLDRDGISDNLEFFVYNTSLKNDDTDDDQISDYDELFTYYTNPLSNDTDGDGINDYDEYKSIAKTLFADLNTHSGKDYNEGYIEHLGLDNSNEYAIIFDNDCCSDQGGQLEYDMPMQSFTAKFEMPTGDVKSEGALWVSIFCTGMLQNIYDITSTSHKCVKHSDHRGFVVGFNYDGSGVMSYISDQNHGTRNIGYVNHLEDNQTGWHDVTIDVNIIEENGDVSTSYDFTSPNKPSGIEILVYVDGILLMEYSQGFDDLTGEMDHSHKFEDEDGPLSGGFRWGVFGYSEGLEFGGKIGEDANTQLSIKNLHIYTNNQEKPSINGAHLYDMDNDGVHDYEEYLLGSDPRFYDSDFDGLSDGEEFYIYNTNLTKRDSDGDGVIDKSEIETFGTDPNGNENPRVFYNGSIPEKSLFETVWNPEAAYNWFLISDFYMSDKDDDGIPDIIDNCQNTYNPSQSDSDSDGLGNSCDTYNNNPPQTSTGRCYWHMDGTYIRLYVSQSECYQTNRASWYYAPYPA